MKIFHLVVLALCGMIVLKADASNTQTNTPNERVNLQATMQEIGYQVGDVARQTIVIRTPKGYAFDSASLPNIGKSAVSIELRHAKWSAKNKGNETVHTLMLDWQIFRVMQETRAYPLKALDLQFTLADKKLTAHVKPAKMLVASVLPSDMKKATAEMNAAQLAPRADVMPKARNTQTILNTLLAALLGLLVAGVYFSWRFDWLPTWFTALFTQPKPFRRAYREIKGLAKTETGTLQLYHAMRALRRACDATTGYTLSAERVALLFNANHQFSANKADIEHFYVASERAFFAGETGDLNMKKLKQLCRALMLIESK